MAAHGVLIRRVITWVGAYWAGGGEALHGENQTPSRPGNIGLSGIGKIIDMGGLLRSFGLPQSPVSLYKRVWMLEHTIVNSIQGFGLILDANICPWSFGNNHRPCLQRDLTTTNLGLPVSALHETSTGCSTASS